MSKHRAGKVALTVDSIQFRLLMEQHGVNRMISAAIRYAEAKLRSYRVNP